MTAFALFVSRFRRLLFVVGVAMCVGILIVLGQSVVAQLTGLKTANSDNLQWTLTQTDVEYLNLRIAIDDATEQSSAGANSGRVMPAIIKARLKFDILYSRLDTLKSGRVYATLIEDPAFSTNYHLAAALMDEMIPIVDLPNDQLLTRLPDLRALAVRAEQPIREMSMDGLARFSKESDSRRETVTTLLIRLAAVTTFLVLLISLLAYWLSRLFHKSERRAESLRVTSLRLETIINSSLDGVIVFDRGGKVLDWNDAANRIFQISESEAVGLSLYPLILGETGRDGQIQQIETHLVDRAAGRTGPERITLTAQRQDGTSFPIELAVETADDGTGSIHVAFVRDIEARLHAEAELKDARDRAVAGQTAKAHFLAVMSHEMRTPLNGLLGTLSLLQETKLRPDQIKMMETIELSGRLLLRHVNDVLDMTQLEAGKMKAENHDFDIGQMVGEVVTGTVALAAERGNRLTWQWCSPRIARVSGDAPRIMQVLLNLVSNAIKFTENGDIRIEVRALADLPPGGACPIEFRVIDTGLGIAPADQSRIFEDFETVDSSYGRTTGGTGLGLGIARRLTQLLGGELGVDSALGKGSAFWLRLPLVPAKSQTTETAQPEVFAKAESARALSVLLVEDNLINRTILRSMVQAAGHTTAEATNGKEGVDLAAVRHFDLILMDISMPVMDGREATKLIRAGSGASRRTPIVAVTAHALPEEIKEFLDCGMDSCLQKPLDRDDLAALLNKIGAQTAMERTAPDSNANTAQVNEAVIASLRDMIGSTQLSALINRFLQDTDLLFDSPQSKDTAADLHRCSGAAGFLGAAALQERIRIFEAAAKRGTPEALAQALPDLRAIWQQTKRALQGLIVQSSEP